MIDEQKTLDLESKGEVGVTDQGCNKTYTNSDSHSNINHGKPANSVDSPKNTQPAKQGNCNPLT